jgi:ERCC4-type nuclease
MSSPKPLVIVSKSEPDDATAKLAVYGLNAVGGEPGSDYVWFPHQLKFAIERKTVTNLLQSLKDRQLVEQAQRGTKEFDRYFLLIEGDYRRAPSGKFQFFYPRHPEARDGWVESGWAFDAVDGMLFDLGLLGVQVIRCDLFDSARRIAAAVLNTSSESHNFLRERQRPDLPIAAQMGGELYSDAIWALCALPGCGPEVATALLHEYGTLYEVIDMLGQGLMAVRTPKTPVADVKVNGRKLGQKRADRLHEAVTKRFN